MTDVLEIRMQHHEAECFICGCECEMQYGVPTFNGDIMSNDWQGDWAGQSVCKSCYDKHERGEIETCDDLYSHHLTDCVNGAGI